MRFGLVGTGHWARTVHATRLSASDDVDVAAARSVIDAVDDAGVASVVYVTPRFVPAVAAWLDEVRAAGGWWGAQTTWLAAAFRDGSPYATSAWRRDLLSLRVRYDAAHS